MPNQCGFASALCGVKPHFIYCEMQYLFKSSFTNSPYCDILIFGLCKTKCIKKEVEVYRYGAEISFSHACRSCRYHIQYDHFSTDRAKSDADMENHCRFCLADAVSAAWCVCRCRHINCCYRAQYSIS